MRGGAIVRVRLETRLAVIAVTVVAGVAAAEPQTTSAPRATEVAVAHLETNATPEALGIDTKLPRLGWRLESERRGVLQRAYRVLVASKPDLVREGAADVWDSGSVASVEPSCAYGGPALRSRTRYYWSVRVWLRNGEPTAWPPPTWFETALLDPGEWKGEWIAGPERKRGLTREEGEADDAQIRAAGEFCRPVAWLTAGFASRVPNDQGECREIRPTPMLRRSFRVAKTVARARVYSSGLAYDLLTVNGEPVSDSLLDPGFTNYGKTVQYTTHDVTRLLRQGENVVATELGSGHFDDATRTWDWGWTDAEWRATPELRLDLYLTYADGSEEVVRSDGSWKASVDGPRRYDSLYLGETYDARKEIPGWRRAGFDDSSWMAARVVSAPAGLLRAESQEPIRVIDTLPPGTRSDPKPGVFVYDVGQNLTGWAEIGVQAPAGTAVELFYSEKLNPDGTASTDGNGLVYGQLQTDYYVARGSGVETWSPAFSYKGFRYLQVSGPGGQPLPRETSVRVERILHVRSSLARTSSFRSSQPTLDHIHRNTIWAIQGNMFGIVTDTPVYEKNPWTGDAQLTAGTASLLFDTERLYGKMIQDMLDAQTPEGELSLLCPTNRNYGYVGKPAFKPVACCGATPAWDAFWFVVPWEDYLRHGDPSVLARAYPAMQRYLDDWIPRWTDKDGDSFAQTLTSGLGDWVAPEGIPTLDALATTAYYAHLVGIAADGARALGRPADARRYDELFAKVRSDFNARFLSEDGAYREKPDQPFLETAQILPLAFGLVPEERRATLAERLAAEILGPRGGNAWVGVLGARDVLPVLTATGHLDAALTVATQTDEPSWGYWTDTLKFTALGESWPANTRSRNHHFFGAIVQWLYEDLAGFRPLEPGYRKIEFRPEIPSAGLDFVEASHESVRGTVATSWRRTPDGLEIEVTVPPNAEGRVLVPAPSPDSVAETLGGSAVAAARAPAVTFMGVEGGRVVYEVGSGRYRFRVQESRVR
jgi:alpha-L-rhamnosidase